MGRSDGGLVRISSKGKKGGGGLLKNQLELVKRKDCERYTIAKIPENLSFEKGFYMFIRACQLLGKKMKVLVWLVWPGLPERGKLFSVIRS